MIFQSIRIMIQLEYLLFLIKYLLSFLRGISCIIITFLAGLIRITVLSVIIFAIFLCSLIFVVNFLTCLINKYGLTLSVFYYDFLVLILRSLPWIQKYVFVLSSVGLDFDFAPSLVENVGTGPELLEQSQSPLADSLISRMNGAPNQDGQPTGASAPSNVDPSSGQNSEAPSSSSGQQQQLPNDSSSATETSPNRDRDGDETPRTPEMEAVIKENMDKMKLCPADGQSLSGLSRQAAEEWGQLTGQSPSEQRKDFIKEGKKERGIENPFTDQPARKVIANEVKDFAANSVDGTGGGKSNDRAQSPLDQLKKLDWWGHRVVLPLSQCHLQYLTCFRLLAIIFRKIPYIRGAYESEVGVGNDSNNPPTPLQLPEEPLTPPAGPSKTAHAPPQTQIINKEGGDLAKAAKRGIAEGMGKAIGSSLCSSCGKEGP